MKTITVAAVICSVISTVFAQTHQVKNEEGNYNITAPATWMPKKEGTITDLYSPEEAADDVWQEYLGISTGEANGLSLEEAFDYYIKTDFPEYYPQFQVIESGKETIGGLPTLWALCSYDASGTAHTEKKSAVVYNLFYLILKDDVLYFLNGIAVETEYPRFDETFRQIIRSFSLSR
jgi:hypothetical protein